MKNALADEIVLLHLCLQPTLSVPLLLLLKKIRKATTPHLLPSLPILVMLRNMLLNLRLGFTPPLPLPLKQTRNTTPLLLPFSTLFMLHDIHWPVIQTVVWRLHNELFPGEKHRSPGNGTRTHGYLA